MPTNSEPRELNHMKTNLTALNENELNEVTGGISLKGARDKAIMATCTAIGSLAGDAYATCLASYINLKTGHCIAKNSNGVLAVAVDSTFILTSITTRIAGLTAGAAAGATVGKEIVDFLNKK